MEAKEDNELASEGSISIADEGEERGGANVECAIYREIPSKGALRLKKWLKMETAKERLKNMYNVPSPLGTQSPGPCHNVTSN